MAIVGPERRVEECTRGFTELVRLELAQTIGSPCHQLFGNGDAPCAGCPVTHAWEAQETVDAIHVRHFNGACVPDRMVATPLDDGRALLEFSSQSVAVGFLRMCANCKSVVVMGEWEPIEVLLTRGNVNITHGLCDACADRAVRR